MISSIQSNTHSLLNSTDRIEQGIENLLSVLVEMHENLKIANDNNVKNFQILQKTIIQSFEKLDNTNANNFAKINNNNVDNIKNLHKNILENFQKTNESIDDFYNQYIVTTKRATDYLYEEIKSIKEN